MLSNRSSRNASSEASYQTRMELPASVHNEHSLLCCSRSVFRVDWKCMPCLSALDSTAWLSLHRCIGSAGRAGLQAARYGAGLAGHWR